MTTKYQTPADARFLRTFGVCEPCDDMHTIWAKYHHTWGLQWTDNSHGWMGEIGKVGDHPVWVSVFWATIGGKDVAFVEPTSMVVDFGMVRDWCRDVFPNQKAHSNPVNFGNLVNVIQDEVGLDLYARDIREVERFLQEGGILDQKYKNPNYLKPLK